VHKLRLSLTLAIVFSGIVMLASGASAVPPGAAQATSSFDYTKNMHPQGYSAFPNTPNFPGQTFTANSDLAFWGKHAFQGHYRGFRILNISAPAKPREISFTECFGNQGDVVVWKDILVRSWNSPATGTGSSQLSCDGEPVALGFEGLHIFDISDKTDPELVGEVELSARPEADMPGCGSHTATLVPDVENGRLLVYNQTSGGNTLLPPGMTECDWLDVIEVPLDDPGAASFLHREPLEGGHAAHDSAVILGDVNLAAVASGHMSNVFDIGDNQWPGGSPEDPILRFTIEEPGVCNTGGPLCNGNWHSAGFTWDGEVIILGWEPGGGAAPECEATDPDVKKSWFFYDSSDGSKLGQFVLPRPQTATENCTIHNYNVVPTNKRYVLVGGNYQAGISVVDFTDPANAEEVAYADPAPLPGDPVSGQPGQLGGDWSTYWYNGRIYESDITRGLIVWKLSDRVVAGARKLDHLNPQTSETSFELKG
jgi:hypothetical protein